MKVHLELSVVPIGVGTSVSKYIAACEDILKEAGLKVSLHALGTNIEGEWDEVFAAVKRCQERLHEMGVERLYTTIKATTRTDRTQSLEDSVRKVEGLMNQSTS